MNKRVSVFALAMLLSVVTAFGQDDTRESGIELYRDGRYAESVDVLRKVVEADPSDKVAWTHLGASLMNLGRQGEAEEAFRKPIGGPKYDPKLQKELRILSRPRAGYTPAARSSNVQGTVVTVVEFRSDGTIGFVLPLKTLPHGLTESAVQAIKGTKFQPAEVNGKKISVIRWLSTEFSIH